MLAWLQTVSVCVVWGRWLWVWQWPHKISRLSLGVAQSPRGFWIPSARLRLLKAENITLADGRTASAPCMLISPETQESHFQRPLLERFGKTVLVWIPLRESGSLISKTTAQRPRSTPPLIQSETSSLAERIRGGWWRWWGGTAGSLCYYPKSSTFRQRPLLLWTSHTAWLSDSRLISITGSIGGVRLTDEAWLARSITSECVQLLSHTEAKCIPFLFLWIFKSIRESARSDTNLQNINLYYFTLQTLFKAPHVSRREHTDVFIRNVWKQSLTHSITWDLLWCWWHFIFSSCFHYWHRLNVNNLM